MLSLWLLETASSGIARLILFALLVPDGMAVATDPGVAGCSLIGDSLPLLLGPTGPVSLISNCAMHDKFGLPERNPVGCADSAAHSALSQELLTDLQDNPGLLSRRV